MSDENQSCDIISHHVIPTERIGAVNVWVQGDLSLAQSKDTKEQFCVFMTVHDVGVNHSVWLRFANNPAMALIREKAVFIHVDLVGQEDGADDLDGPFPTMQQIGEDLVNILDHLRIKCVIGIGEGAGANILLRFGAMHVQRCLGVICVNPNETSPTIMDNLLDRIKSFRSDDKPLTAQQKQMNQANVSKFMGAYMNRTDIMPIVEKSQGCETMLVAGAKADSHVKGMEAVFSRCDKAKTSMLKIDDVANVLEDAPGKFANAILLFAKGQGWLTSVDLPNVERRSSKDSVGGRRMSMEEYDKPNIRRLSLTGTN